MQFAPGWGLLPVDIVRYAIYEGRRHGAASLVEASEEVGVEGDLCMAP